MFEFSKLKIGCSSSITKRWIPLSPCNVRKNDVQVCSMSDLVILINKGPIGSMFNVLSFKPKNRMLEFNHQSFKFVRCSKNDVQVRSMFNKMVFDPSLDPI